MEGCLAAAKGFVEFRFSPTRWGGEVLFLLGGDCANLAATAGIRRVELGCDHYWLWGGGGGRRGFVGKEGGNQGFLEFGCVDVGCGVWEVEVAEEHIDVLMEQKELEVTI